MEQSLDWSLDKQKRLCMDLLNNGFAHTPLQLYFLRKCIKSNTPLKLQAVKILKDMILRKEQSK